MFTSSHFQRAGVEQRRGRKAWHEPENQVKWRQINLGIFETKFAHYQFSLTLHKQLMCCPTWKSAFLINL